MDRVFGSDTGRGRTCVLRTKSLSCGIAPAAKIHDLATVIALSGTADDARVSGVSSDSVKSDQPTEAVLGYNRQQEAASDNEVIDRTSKTAGTKHRANSETHKTHATTPCLGNNLPAGNMPPAASS